MPAKLGTTIKNIEIKVENETNRRLIREFYEYLTIKFIPLVICIKYSLLLCTENSR